MTNDEFQSVLDSVIGQFDLKLVDPRGQSVEVDTSPVCPGMKKFLEWEVGPSDHVAKVHFWFVAGQITSAEAFGALLRDNKSGVSGSPFFASALLNQRQQWLLTFESLQIFPQTISLEAAKEVLEALIANPIFLELEVGRPTVEGVQLFL